MIKAPIVRIHPSTVYRTERVLPVAGDIVVQLGDTVNPETPIARVVMPTPPAEVPVAATLGVRPKDLAAHLLKQVGDQAQQGEVIARRKATLREGKKECVAPTDGSVESVSFDTGYLTIKRPARPTVVWAEAVGKVTAIVPNQAVIIETSAGVVQGVLGVGGEVFGQLRIAVNGPNEKISPNHLDRSYRGSVVVAGGIEDDAVLAQAEEMGVKGLILGGVTSKQEKWMTKGKTFPLSIIVTDGFGAGGIFPPAFDALRRNQGKQVWLRPSSTGKPEAVILLSNEPTREVPKPPSLARGALVRVTRSPYLGLYGRVSGLPSTLRTLESGVRASVAEIVTIDGRSIVAPIANLEIIG